MPDDEISYGVLFKWAEPLDIEDGKQGQICVRSHFWFPGHLVVWTDEGPVGRPFAGADEGGEP